MKNRNNVVKIKKKIIITVVNKRKAIIVSTESSEKLKAYQL